MIEGAAEGAGLGIRFLKHLARTRLLLHLVDIAPWDGSDPVDNVDAIAGELQLFSPALAARDRWLVLNKLDLMPADEADQRCQQIVDELQWEGPVFKISAVSGEGTDALVQGIMNHIEEVNERLETDTEFAELEAKAQAQLEEEARNKVQEVKSQRKSKKSDDDDDDDHDVEVVYAPY